MIDLFAGCGGLSQGFRAAFDPVLAVEHDHAAAATYAANFGPEHVHQGDIATVTDVPEVDLVVGGPPCQGFSALGSRDVDDPRNALWREYFRVVRAARPRAFVIENVDRFLGSAEFALLRTEAAAAGYELSWGLLLAADFGVPQRRKRAFVLGSRVGALPLPTPTHTRADWVGVRTAITGLPAAPASTTLPSRSVRAFGRTLPGDFRGLDLHVGRNPTPLSLARYRAIPPGGGRFDLPDDLLPRCWREKRTGTTDVMGRMRWDQPSLTIRTEFFKPEKGRYLHPEHHRPITHLEAARLQSFPDTFRWRGSKIEIARQIGNAVPPLLAGAVAARVADHLG
ncbi:DNA (cytosine-5-)-methyltransferase [Actinokineospora bangkokensis]|uniref:Cytosine-specific methyltransferase n=2 Tax=Actinokineospora bangkokensis TaxID=1193682 RepID=A0A1Q9LD29_9PSEU|nr:DNA (cytosine-5-)-methyltransferase [Actinokineospora bangkokensis]